MINTPIDLDYLHTSEQPTVSESDLKTVVSSELTQDQKVISALKAAVTAIYFNDNSDYLEYLWEIVGTLGGNEMVELLGNNEKVAFDKCVQDYIDNSC
jgi:hypothetical protein